jgi:tetratricopeptide (TPR) repeat protein
MKRRLKRDFADAENNLGAAYLALGRSKEAIESFKRAIRINPALANAHYNLGLVLHASGNRVAAVRQYALLRALESDLAPHLLHQLQNAYTLTLSPQRSPAT